MDTLKSPYLDKEGLELPILKESQPFTKELVSPYLTPEFLYTEDLVGEPADIDEAWQANELESGLPEEALYEVNEANNTGDVSVHHEIEIEHDHEDIMDGDTFHEEFANRYGNNELLDEYGSMEWENTGSGFEIYDDLKESDQEYERQWEENVTHDFTGSKELEQENSDEDIYEDFEYDDELNDEEFDEDELDVFEFDEDETYDLEFEDGGLYVYEEEVSWQEMESANAIWESLDNENSVNGSEGDHLNEAVWFKKKVVSEIDTGNPILEQEQDGKLYAKLKSARSHIAAKNWFWWSNLNLSKIMPFGPIGPHLPNKYANLAFDLQSQFNKAKLYTPIGKRLVRDGILGIKTWFLLLTLADASKSQNSKIRDFLDKNTRIRTIINSIKSKYNGLSELDRELFNQTRADVAADVIKPKKIVGWGFKTKSTGFYNFLKFNERIQRTKRDGIEISNEIFDNLVRYLIADPGEAQNIIETLEFSDKLQMLRLFYGENKILRARAIIYRANRSFIHRFDSQKLNPHKKYPRFSFGFNTASGAYLKQIAPLLNLKFSKNRSVRTALQKMAMGLGNNNPIHAIVLWFYFPKESKQKFKETKSFIVSRVIEIQAGQRAALDYTNNLNAKIDKQKKGIPDISDSETFMELITYPANKTIRNKVNIELLLKRAEQQLYLIVKLGKKGETMVLPFLKIKELQAQALKNGNQPLRYGKFKPKSKAYRTHTSKYKATISENSVRLNIKETLFADRPRNFNRFEPVKVVFGLITQKPFRGIKYNEKVFWVMSDSLGDIATELEKTELKSGAFEGLNIVIIAASGIGVGVAALRASMGSALAPAVGKSFLKELIKKSLLFAVEEAVAEALVQKFLEMDKKITEDDQLSEEEKGLWKAFKTGLMVVGGTLVLRQAWKGLKQVASPKLIGHLDEWELALLKAEARASAKGGKALAYAGFRTANAIVAKGAKQLTDARKWAGAKLRLPISIVRDLGLDSIRRLKLLPPKSLEQISKLNVWAKRLFLGCASPCKPNIPRIKKGLENLKQLLTPRTGIELLKRGLGSRRKRVDKLLLRIVRMRRALVGITKQNFIDYNVAVGKFVIKDGRKKRVIYLSVVNKPGGKHSEELLLERLASLEKKYGRGNVKLDELFTERIPCVGKGKNPSNCRLKLDIESPETVVFFGVSDDVKRVGKTKIGSLMGIYGL